MSASIITPITEKDQFEEVIQGKWVKFAQGPRIAMVGRSNVGKSSLINHLTESSVARISKQPGKTRNLYFYSWKEAEAVLVDLPGYGFASAAKKEKERWDQLIQAYLQRDPYLQLALILLDSRHGPTDKDYQAIEYFRFLGVPLWFIMTKADTLKRQSERVHRRREVEKALQEYQKNPDLIFWVSCSKKKTGIRGLREELKRAF